MLTSLHPALIPGLDQLPEDLPVTLFTRHSIREQPRSGFAGYDVPLTPEGIALAEAWGGALRRPLRQVLSSPVGRCVETARAMLAGTGQALTVNTHPLLVEPGCYVEDIRHVGRRFIELGPVGFANLHFREPLAGIRSPDEGTRRLVEVLRAQEAAAGEFNLFVTHDTILAAFIYTLAGIREISEEDWPWMMEGAYVWFRDDRVHWLWRGQGGSRRLDSLG